MSESEDLGEAVPIGELAHNVGWSSTSPRGESAQDSDARRQAANLLLLCRNCHKPMDDGGVVGRYTVEVLDQFKREHEERIRALTDIGADRSAFVLRIVGQVRGINPELTHDTVLEATTTAGLFPKSIPGNFRAEYDLDFRDRNGQGTPSHFEGCARDIDELLDRVNDGVRRSEVTRVAVFAFARIPVLVHLGARLDDKLPALIFQRHRVDDGNAWRWPTAPTPPPDFAVGLVSRGTSSDRVALIVNLSGTVEPEHLPSGMTTSHSLYQLSPVLPAATGPSVIDSQAALANFDRTARQFLALVETEHSGVAQIPLFSAAPMSAAITLGRVLMPNVSPAWVVYDRDEAGKFFRALEVHR